MTAPSPTSRPERSQAARLFSVTAGFYLVAWAIHGADHLRRGLFDIPLAVQALGYIQVFLTLGFIWLLGKRHPLAPIAAIAIGIPATIGIALAHILPDFGPVGDSLWTEGIGGFTWFAVILEILGSVVLTAGGWLAWRSVDYAPPALRAGRSATRGGLDQPARPFQAGNRRR